MAERLKACCLNNSVKSPPTSTDLDTQWAVSEGEIRFCCVKLLVFGLGVSQQLAYLNTEIRTNFIHPKNLTEEPVLVVKKETDIQRLEKWRCFLSRG